MVIVKDPVCGMVFVKEDAAGKTEYKGETYYFCAPSCKKSFEREPEKYLEMFNHPRSCRQGIDNKGDELYEKGNGLCEHD